MHRWYSIFPENQLISIYTWIAFCFLPFFFIFKSSSALEISIGLSLLLLFFVSYRFSFRSHSGLVYMCLSFEIFIDVMMSLLFALYILPCSRPFAYVVLVLQVVFLFCMY